MRCCIDMERTMTTDELAALRGSLQALAIFRGLLADPVVAALDRCLALRTDRNAAPVEANAGSTPKPPGTWGGTSRTWWRTMTTPTCGPSAGGNGSHR